MRGRRSRDGTGSGLKRHPSADRVGYRGLRPGTLPHHRTYGFPYPAVGPGGLPAGRNLRWHHKSVTLQIAFRQGRVHHRPRRDKPRAAPRWHIAQHPLGHAQAPQGAATTPHAQVPASIGPPRFHRFCLRLLPVSFPQRGRTLRPGTPGNLLHAVPVAPLALLLGPSALCSSGVSRLLGYYGFC